MIAFPIPLGVFYIEIIVLLCEQSNFISQKISLYCTTSTERNSVDSLPTYHPDKQMIRVCYSNRLRHYHKISILEKI